MYEVLYGSWLHKAEFVPIGSGVCQNYLCVLIVELVGSCFDVIQTTDCVDSGTPWESIQCCSMSGASSDGSWDTCLEL